MTRKRRTLRFDTWEEVFADIENLQSTGYDHASYGKLKLGPMCVHLARVLEGAVSGFPKVFSWPFRIIARWLFLSRMLAHKPMNLRVRTDPSMEPPTDITDEEGVARFRHAIDAFRNHTGEYEPHLVFGKLTREQWLHQVLWHTEHHLSFLIPREVSA